MLQTTGVQDAMTHKFALVLYDVGDTRRLS